MTAALGFRRLGLAALALAAVGVAALALAPVMISSQSVREAVKAEIRAASRLDPILRGAAEVSLFPFGAVNFSDVVLGSAQDGEPPLRAERLTANLHLFPLLLGRVEVADISLLRPRIVIDVGAGGRSNWSALVETLARTLRPDAAGPRAAVFSEIRVAGGIVEYRDPLRGIDETIGDIDMSLAWPSISNSFGATGRFVWRDEPVEANLVISNFFAALVGERSGVKIRIGGAPLKLAFEGAISRLPTVKIDGTLAADAPSLRQAMRWSGHRMLPGGGFGHFSLKAQAVAVGGTISLSQAHVELDGNAAEGVLSIATDGRQSVQGTLAMPRLDLNPYIANFRLLTADSREWDRGPIALDGLEAIDLDLRLSAQEVLIDKARLGRTALGANLRGGKLALTIGESQAFGGLVQGSLALARSDAGADVSARVIFTDVDLERCLRDMFGVRRVEGKGTINVAAAGSGQSVHAIAGSLSGNVSLDARGGGLNGFNVEQLLRRLERRPLSGGGEFRSGRTAFTQIAFAVKANAGHAHIAELRLEGPAVRIAATGLAAIATREIDLKGTASLLSSAKDQASAFDLPFIVQGPWDDPLILPDPQSLIRRSGAATPHLNANRTRAPPDVAPLAGGNGAQSGAAASR
ncbi:MAG: AsmA family protein [Proteobacteria bacterium]|nr:AsmA family protein [Pseudomonadota bacterium]